eukprot:scaffold230000_cov34-Prasinocladus_malaysianus.AAC.1
MKDNITTGGSGAVCGMEAMYYPGAPESALDLTVMATHRMPNRHASAFCQVSADAIKELMYPKYCPFRRP